MWPKLRDASGNRYCIWPIELVWGKVRKKKFFDCHSFPIGKEQCKTSQTAVGSENGWRGVFGQTLHIGSLNIILG